MSFLSLICSSLPSLQQMGPAAHLTSMWGPHDSSVHYLQQRLWGDRDRGEGRGAGSRARTRGGPRGPRARSGWRGHGLLCGRPGALDETHLSLPPPPPRGRAPPMGGAVGGHGCRRDQLDGERPLGEAEQGGELGLGLGRCLRIRRPAAADRRPGRRASPGGAGGRATAYSAPAATGADGRRRARPR